MGWCGITDRRLAISGEQGKYWSPAYKDVYRDRQGWANSIDGLDVPYYYSCEQACGHIEDDQSGTINKYSIPCRLLFEGMGMEYDSHDGQYLDKDGNLYGAQYKMWHGQNVGRST